MGKYIQISELCSWIISFQATSTRFKGDITKNMRSFLNLNMCILFPWLILSKVTFLEATSFHCDIKAVTVEKQVIYLKFLDSSTHMQKKKLKYSYISHIKREVSYSWVFSWNCDPLLKLQETSKHYDDGLDDENFIQYKNMTKAN